MDYKYMTTWKKSFERDLVLVFVYRYGWPSGTDLIDAPHDLIVQEILNDGVWVRYSGYAAVQPTITITGQEIARGGIAAR